MYLIKNSSTDPYFNLAVEEYFLDHIAEEAVLLWRNDKAVIIGKNQNAIEEINQNYVSENDIAVVRRLTGGGAVFHDLGNINFTVIQKANDSLFSNYAYFTKPVCDFLRTLGVDAQLSGRNDLLINGLKFSGNAQTIRNGKVMHHGTLLFSSNVDDISGSLNPDKIKIESKGVKSVKSRITNISSNLESLMSVEVFFEQLHHYFQNNIPNSTRYELTSKDIAAINELVKHKYATWNWNYGNSPQYTWQNRKKFDFGIVDVRLMVKDGQIQEAKIFGDFFGISNIEEIEKRLVGTLHKTDALAHVLKDLTIREYISGMENSHFLDILQNGSEIDE